MLIQSSLTYSRGTVLIAYTPTEPAKTSHAMERHVPSCTATGIGLHACSNWRCALIRFRSVLFLTEEAIVGRLLATGAYILQLHT